VTQYDDFIKKEKKKNPEANFRLGDDKDLVIVRKSTGIPNLDKIIGGGLPVAKTILFIGPYSAGKTLLSQKIVAEAQRRGESAAYIDVERAYDPYWWKVTGVDIGKLVVSQPSCGEAALDACIQAVESEFDFVILDSAAALVPTAELDQSVENQSVGSLARLLNRGLRKITQINTKTTFIMLNQIRMTIGQGPYVPEALPGGKAQQHFASIILRVSRGAFIKDGANKVGFTIHFRVEKNKVGTAHGETSLPFYLSGYMDIPQVIVDLALELGVVTQAGPYFSYKDKKILGKLGLVKYLQENPEEFDELKRLVLEIEPNVEVSDEANEND